MSTTTNKKNSSDYDIIIVGGGLAGLLAANLLTKHPHLNIALIANDTISSKLIAHKPLALNTTSCQLLHSQNLWQPLAKTAIPIKHLHVSAKNRFGALRIDANQYQQPALAYLTSATKLIKQLAKPLMKNKSISIFEHSEVVNINYNTNKQRLQIQQNGQTLELTGNLLIGADGINSICRQQANIATENPELNYSALVINAKTDIPHQATAYQRHLPKATIAFLPDQTDGGSIVITAATTHIKSLSTHTKTELLKYMQQAFGFRLGKFIHIKKPVYFPIFMQKANTTASHGLVLTGNAATSFAPVTAQGLNLAFRDIGILIDLISAKTSIDAVEIPNEYRSLRDQEHTDLFKHSQQFMRFSSQESNCIRALGLNIINTIPYLKQKTYQYGIGLRQPMPKNMCTKEFFLW